MITNFIITFRESLEAFLVVGIVLAYLNRANQTRYNRYIWWAVGSGVTISIVLALLFNIFLGGLTGRTEEIFEGIMMLLAALLLTWMILWMMKQKHIAHEIEEKVQREISEEHAWGLFTLVFLAILREGVETVIFLNAAVRLTKDFSFLGAILGIVAAMIIGYFFFLGAKKIKIKTFFQITTIILVLFASGLIAHGIHEFQEAAILPIFREHLFDINFIINEKGTLGSILKSLFGYNGNPSLLEFLSYFGYLTFNFILYKKIEKIHKII